MKNPRLIAAVAAALALAGCASTGPSTTPAAEAPAQWHAPVPHNGALGDLATWWRQFDDPLLVELIESAQKANPTVASAASRISQARAIRIAAGALLVPEVDAVGSASRGNSQPPVPLATITQAGLQAAWEIDLFG